MYCHGGATQPVPPLRWPTEQLMEELPDVPITVSSCRVRIFDLIIVLNMF